jgi:hypothetical protein
VDVAKSTKVYNFPLDKVEGRIVAYFRQRRNESTVADVMAATGIPKYQVEQTLRQVLDEYSGRLKVTESGELLYYFPAGMRSRLRGFIPRLKRGWKVFLRGAARVLALLFKIWIVAMLIGYFVAFLLIMILAVVASFAASAAGGSRGERGGRDRMRLLDLALRMWIYSSLLDTLQGKRQKKPPGRAFYKSVFGFVFGDEDPNADWDTREKTLVISFIKARRGVITNEELMALTGKDGEEAQALMNRYLLEFEGDPGVTDSGTLIYSFPELLRTTEAEQQVSAPVSLDNPPMKKTLPFSLNKPKTNAWIIFFNTFNLLFGTFFFSYAVTHGSSIVPLTVSRARGWLAFFSTMYSVAYGFLESIGVSPAAFIAVVLGIIPVSFSLLFFLIPLFRKLRLSSRNEGIREENLRKKIYAEVLFNPAHADPLQIPKGGPDSTPKKFNAVRERIFTRFAALKSAEPEPKADGGFTYRFGELEREIADVEEYRRKVDIKSLEVGKTVFDSGQ